jgi:hypothetical protein
LKTHGVKHETCSPHSPAQNGQSERLNRTLKASARAALKQSHLPQSFWEDALLYAADVSNCSPSATRDNETPYFRFSGKDPDLSLRHAFGNKCWKFIEEKRTATDARALECRFLRPLNNTTKFLVFDVHSGKTHQSKNIKFIQDESRFQPIPTDFFTSNSTQVSIEDISPLAPLDPSQSNPSLSEDVSISDQPTIGVCPEPLRESFVDCPSTLPLPPPTFDNSRHVRVTEAIIDMADEARHPQMEIPASVDILTDDDHFYDADITPVELSLSLLNDNGLKLTIPSVDSQIPILLYTQPEYINSTSSSPQSNIPIESTPTNSPVFSSQSILLPKRNLELNEDDESVTYKKMDCVDTTTHRRSPRLEQLRVARTYHTTKSSLDPDNPTISEALAGPHRLAFLAAYDSEIQSLRSFNCFEIIDTPHNARILGSKLICKVKRNAEGLITKAKVRLVAQGFRQLEGIDYIETYAPVVSHSTLMTIIALSNQFGWFMHQIDVDSAYLNSPINEVIYLQPPSLMNLPKDKTLKLNKSIYGLKQAGADWYTFLSTILKKLQWKVNIHDKCLFTRNSGDTIEMIAVYVDDILIVSNLESNIQTIKNEINKQIKIKDLGELNELLGIRFIRSQGTILLDQQRLIESSIERFGFNSLIPINSPMNERYKPIANNETSSKDQVNLYQRYIGTLLYISLHTRPDIAYSTSLMSRFASNPSSDHFAAVIRIFRYLIGTSSKKLVLSKNNQHLEVVGYSDSDWAGDKTDAKSTSGILLLIGNSPIIWRSIKQTCIAQSAMEAEYIAANEISRELVSAKYLLESIGFAPLKSTIYCDNNAAQTIINGGGNRNKSKHIDVKYHYVKELREQGQFEINRVCSKDNPADLFTKPLPIETLNKHSQRIMDHSLQ